MKASDIVRQLQRSVNTDNLYSLASNIVSIANTVSGTWLVVTSAATNLVTGSTFSLTSVKTPTYINTATIDDNVINCNTYPIDHDLNLHRSDIGKTVLINGVYYPLLSVHNRYEFSVANPGTDPDLTGQYLQVIYPLGFNSLHTVVDVISPTSFTFSLDTVLREPNDVTGTKINTAFRISGAIDYQTAFDSYTQQNDENVWLFVVLGDYSANKNRINTNDAPNTHGAQSDYFDIIIGSFSVYCFIPNKGANPTNQNGRALRDLIEQPIRQFLFKSLLRFNFPTYLSNNTQSTVSYGGDGYHDYNAPIYVHKFDFNQILDVTNSDVCNEDVTRAFRDLELNLANQFSDTQYTAEVNIDEIPYLNNDEVLGFGAAFGAAFGNS